MRKRAGWMNKASDPVLEVLAEAGVYMTRSAVNHNIQIHPGDQPGRSTVYDAFSDLEKHGLIEKNEGQATYYRITDKGKAYLEGELDASDVGKR